MYVFEWARLDYDDYPIGQPFDAVGFFDSHEEASNWVKENYGVKYYWEARHPTDLQARPQINQVRYNMLSPEEAATKLALARSFR